MYSIKGCRVKERDYVFSLYKKNVIHNYYIYLHNTYNQILEDRFTVGFLKQTTHAFTLSEH